MKEAFILTYLSIYPSIYLSIYSIARSVLLSLFWDREDCLQELDDVYFTIKLLRCNYTYKVQQLYAIVQVDAKVVLIEHLFKNIHIFYSFWREYSFYEKI